MDKWIFSKPEFIFEKDIPDFTWAGHTFFAYDLIKNKKPKTLVELGSYKGTSSASFMQGVKDEGLETDLYFVDSWEGEEQTGFYTEDVYTIFTNLVKKYFSDLKVHPLKMYFDEALKQFEDKSVDILHIDGLHTYDAVKHDYNTWKRTVKDDGVILFHDIKVSNFGVKEVWEEVKAENPNATFIEFEHNYGLGVMFKDSNLKSVFTPEKINEIKDYYFEISSKFRLQQRVIELEHTNLDLENGSKNLDRMLREVLTENTQLYKKIDSIREDSQKVLDRTSVRFALSLSDYLRNIRSKLKR